MARKPAVLVSLIADWDGSDLKKANKQLEETQTKAQAAAQKMGAIGKKLSLAVTAPLVGLGVAAGKMAMDFDDSMSKIVGLVGIGADEVDKMRESVLGLAGETAQAPVQLADAMFVVQSAGLRGADAMQALEFAAKAGSAGLGETADVARSVAGALNAYGSDVLSAAEATDIIVATARAGNFETSQFAGALGDVLPFAQAAQASFEDVGGAVALLTRTNGNASKSITQVTALFRAFAAPSRQTQTLLAEVGLSAQDMRDAMAEQGLTGALRTLDEALGGNREQLGLVLGSSEATAAALQVLNADANTLEGTFGTVANSAGLTDEAFDAASETAGFKFRQAVQSLQATMITFGDELAPVISAVSGGMTSIANALGSIPGPMKTVMVGVAGVVAAFGPLLLIGSKAITMFVAMKARAVVMATGIQTAFFNVRVAAYLMSTNIKAATAGATTSMGALAAGSRVMAAGVITAFRTIGAAAKGLIASFGPIGLAFVGITIAIEAFMGRSSDMRAELGELKDTVDKTTGSFTELTEAMVREELRLNLSDEDLRELEEYGITFQELVDAVVGGPKEFQHFRREVERVHDEVGNPWALVRATEAVDDYRGALDEASREARIARDAAFAAARGTDASGSSANESVYAYNAATGSLELLADGYDIAGDAALDFAGDVSQSAAIGAQAATAIGVAMGQVPQQALNAINQPWYFEMLRRIRNVGDETAGSVGRGSPAEKAFDEYKDIVQQATQFAQGEIDSTIEDYRRAYEDAAQDAADFSAGLAQGVAGGLSFSAAVDAAKEGGGSIVEAINAQASKVGTFNQQLIDLLDTGLSEEAFMMVAEMSAERGSALASELLGANGETMINELNTITSAMDYVTKVMGEKARVKFRQEGVTFAQQTYEGIRDNFKKGGPAHQALMKLMNKLARESARTAEIEVRVTKRINEEVTRVVSTIYAPNPATPGPQPSFGGATGAIVTRPTFALIGEAGPEALVPLNRAPGASPVDGLRGGGNINITVNAGMGTDGAEVGRQVVDAIRAYERRNGRVYASA